MAVGLVYNHIYLNHETGTHVENPDRLLAIMEYINTHGLKDRLVHVEPKRVGLGELEGFHTRKYISRVEEVGFSGGGWLDQDTVISVDSYETALYAVGGVLEGVDKVLSGELESAFVMCRPPGHHALPEASMGFCIFNNVALGALHALNKHRLKRVAVVDFDVHHGNGIQHVCLNDPRVTYISTHQIHHFPFTGDSCEDGPFQNILNIPLPAGCGDSHYQKVFDQLICPYLRKLSPELILVCAGYDAHFADDMGEMCLSQQGFAGITRALKKTADEVCGGKMVFSLEGGYHYLGLAESVGASLAVLLDEALPPPNTKAPEETADTPDISGLILELRGIFGIS
ncbi:histone deacetylase family protein [Dehalococcoides mccartyi]|uniref:Histone deacetylase family protein n=1 Tax=Dehalococcoides mccartyi (strain ATCC BAA-2266 / KCTC 15142 / 195) TaxID=243164 RepID=Q3Z9M2_DEHM1|nr:histone deacetylase [Dehalococcoides mccartyi]AAW40434.1 histone deacetylase family protein [Dehalococcoides mccartyi 195]